MTELVIRPLIAGEQLLFDSLSDPGLVGRAAFGRTYADGGYRPDWSWIALRDNTVVARAAWWAGPDDDAPFVLDWFDFTDADAAVELLRTAPFRTEYSMPVPADWRTRPDVRTAVESRIAAATEAGLRLLVACYRYHWTPSFGLPARPNRLVYRPEPDDEAFLDVFRRIHQGTLDAHAGRAVAAHGVDAAAKEDLDILRWMPSPRGWWRLAYRPDGALVGLAVPSRNYADPVIGYIGVVPEHRGQGYAYDLLVEATHVLVDNGADRVIAATDVPNTPMAAAFAKAGYPIVAERIDLV
jgi:RimJ/RimL family protein N-acetyltransferase